MDIIYLNDLRIDTVIGIFDWERRVKQTISLDIEMATDIRKAASSDTIDDTLDYKAVAKRIIAFVEQSEFQLVETLAERICEIILTEFNVPWVKLRLNKQGAVRGARDVGVLIRTALGHSRHESGPGERLGHPTAPIGVDVGPRAPIRHPLRHVVPQQLQALEGAPGPIQAHMVPGHLVLGQHGPDVLAAGLSGVLVVVVDRLELVGNRMVL